MPAKRSMRPSAAMIVALIALVGSFGGAAMAINKNAVKSKHIAKKAVKSKHIAKNAVKSKQIARDAVKSKQIAAGAVTTEKIATEAVTGEKLDESTLGPVPAVQGLNRVALAKVATSADSASDTLARAAATPIELHASGPFRLYGKCFRNTSTPTNPTVKAELFIATNAPGAVYDGDGGDSSPGFLEPGTPEIDRMVTDVASAAGPDPGTNNLTDSEAGPFWAAQGTSQVTGQLFAGTKVGNPAAGNGIFGPGDGCIFGGYVISR